MDILIGKVTHFYTRLSVAVVDLVGELNIGEIIVFQGHTTDLVQKVFSMEIDHEKLQKAGPNEEVAIKVIDPVRKGDLIFKVAEGEEDPEKI